MSNHSRGVAAESQALAYLSGLGFELIAQRYRNAHGEIDLIVCREQELRFIEVKARKTLEDGLYALPVKQQRRIWNCALGFLAEHADYQHCDMQFDLIAIADSQLQHETNIVLAES